MSAITPEIEIKRGPRSPYTVKVKVLAVSKQMDASASSNVEQRILERVKNCLQRANHPNTAEQEAKTALRYAGRLMAQYNITQADLLDQSRNDSDYAALGGQSVVAITKDSNGTSRIIAQTWAESIADAMTILFDCNCYSTRYWESIEWSFYGIAGNTVTAAMAFEMAYNLILDWARNRKGRSAKHSYCTGVGEGLIEIAADEKIREAEQAKEKEKQSEIYRQDTYDASCLQGGQKANASYLPGDKDFAHKISVDDYGPNHVDCHVEEDGSVIKKGNQGYQDDIEAADDDDDECEAEMTFNEVDELPLDLDMDLDQKLDEMASDCVRKASSGSKKSDEAGQLTPNSWNTSQALVKFRRSAEKVASEYLKAQNIDLEKGPSRETSIKDWEAYEAGIEDSRKIDLKRKRIEDA